MRLLTSLLRWILLTLIGTCLVAACVMLIARYAVLPNINEWRPLIERNLSSTLGLDVRIKDVSAEWRGLNPTLDVQGLSVADAAGKSLLSVPGAHATVSWRSIFAGGLRLARLELDGLVVSVTRLEDGRLSVAGRVLDAANEQRLEINSQALAVNWLLGQGVILARGTTLRWNDALRRAPELALTDVDVELSNGLFSHRLAIRANVPPELGKSFEFAVRADHVLQRLGTKANREAEVYFEVQDFNPQALRAWVDFPDISGRYAARGWIDVQQGKLGQAVVDIAARGVGVPVSGTLPVPDAGAQASAGQSEAGQAATKPVGSSGSIAGVAGPDEPVAVFFDEAQLRLTGWLSDLLPEARMAMFARSTDASGVGVTLRASGAHVISPTFEPSLMPLGRVDLAAQVSSTAGGKLALKVSRFSLSGPNAQASVEGSWQAGGDSAMGIADLRGTIGQMPVDLLHRYIPKTISVQSRAWLRNALIQGRAADVTFQLQGDLTHFPFNAPGAQGQFRVNGAFHDLTLDYDHGSQDVPGWPLLISGDGTFSIDKMRLGVTGRAGTLAGARGERIAIQSIDVAMPDMDLDPHVTIKTVLRGEGDSFISILRASPAAARFGDPINTASVSGEITLPLEIELNLDEPDKPAVTGSIRFEGNSVSVDKAIPKIENLRGIVEFTDQSVRTEDLRARLLDGDARVVGSLGAGGKGLQVDGTLSAASLLELADRKNVPVIDGKATYQMRLKELGVGGYDLTVSSPLVGMSIALPAPLGKTADQRQIFSLRWVSTQRRTDSRHTYTVTLGDALNLRMERYTGVRTAPYFTRAALGIGTPVELPEAGMIVEVVVDKLDWDRWKEHSDQLLRPTTPPQPGSEIFPDIQRMRARASAFSAGDITLTNADVRMTQHQRDQWTATLASKETDATVSWRESSGALAGRVVARVSRLSIGEAATTGDEPPKVDSINESQWSDLPAVDLTIDDFVLYGNRLGKVHLQGSNIERGERWNIERLDVENPYAKLSGQGLWTLKGPARGVKLAATMDVSDLGQLSSFMGYTNRVREGSGTLTAKVDWRNFPWTISYEGLDGEAKIAFEKGVFEHVSSRSARLLELLSLQSLSRILRLDFRPGNEFQNGFPWSSISGDIGLASGVVSTKNLLVASPIAEVLLAGNSDLSRKIWNMQADVKPIFDMSGAAIATGFAVNPLLGLGALVTQFLLRTPIEHVMTARYSVTGPWDDPKLVPLDGGQVANTSGQSNPSEFANPGAAGSAPGANAGAAAGASEVAGAAASGAAGSAPVAPSNPVAPTQQKTTPSVVPGLLPAQPSVQPPTQGSVQGSLQGSAQPGAQPPGQAPAKAPAQPATQRPGADPSSAQPPATPSGSRMLVPQLGG